MKANAQLQTKIVRERRK